MGAFFTRWRIPARRRKATSSSRTYSDARLSAIVPPRERTFENPAHPVKQGWRATEGTSVELHPSNSELDSSSRPPDDGGEEDHADEDGHGADCCEWRAQR